MCFALLLRRLLNGSRGYAISSVDIKKAFETVSRPAVVKFAEEKKFPNRTITLLREFFGKIVISMIFGDIECPPPLDMESGLRQGGPDSS